MTETTNTPTARLMGEPRTPFNWPEWVPAKVRAEVEEFWTRFGRSGGDAWRQNAESERAPQFGEVVRLRSLRDAYDAEPSGYGRYVHAWNNIGRLVHDDGTFDYVSFGPCWRQEQAPDRTATEATHA